jgi:hypothetical protein
MTFQDLIFMIGVLMIGAGVFLAHGLPFALIVVGTVLAAISGLAMVTQRGKP